MRSVLALLLVLGFAAPALGQGPAPDSADVASPEAIVLATYASIARAPGEAIQWDRFRSLFLPEATLLPNLEQTGGEARVLSPQGFVDWISAFNARGVGNPADRGFTEDEVHNEVMRYGDIAQVFSTYEKHRWQDDEMLGRGINSFQLVHRDGRWWVVSIAWDEEAGAGPVPEALRGE